MEDNGRLAGHIHYITSVLGNNAASAFRKIYTEFKLEDLDELKELLKKMNLQKLGEGSTRETYSISDTKVIKIPCGNNNYQWAEIEATLTEAIVYKKTKRMKIFVPTELYFFKSVPVLIADKVSPMERDERMIFAATKEYTKKFNRLCDGSWQIGKTSNGEVRCFDFGLEEHLIPADKKDVPKNFSKKMQREVPLYFFHPNY
jgi:hypothetical protein